MKSKTNIDHIIDGVLLRLSQFPWRTTASVLWERLREDRLGLVASSLTFTTIISLVPLFTMGLAIFSSFPVFTEMQIVLQKWLIANLIPENISKQVLSHLVSFTKKANRLSGVSLGFIVISAIALTLTIDRVLNSIWRINKPGRLTQRVLIYWALLTLGPLVFGASLMLSSFAWGATRSLFGLDSDAGKGFFSLLEFVIVIGALTALYRYVPRTTVDWRHALTGAAFAGLGIELGKRILAWHFSAFPTYSTIYGAFSAVPILLVWIYVAWLMVLLGAVITAYLPSLLSGVARRKDHAGWNFQVAIEVVKELLRASKTKRKGLTQRQMAALLRVSPLQIEPALEALLQLDWIALLNEQDERYVLLADPLTTPMKPLIEILLLPEREVLQKFYYHSGWNQLLLVDVVNKRA